MLGLGSAQFGMPYGISNRHGQADHDELTCILRLAADAGIDIVDTAASYGDSERALGMAIPDDHSFRIVTKTAPAAPQGGVREGLLLSLLNLRQRSIYGLLVHHAEVLLGAAGDKLWREMEDLHRERLVQKIGVSVYTASQIDRLLDRYAPDIMQVPVNVFDQRLVQSGHLEHLKSRGIEVHVRSVFLQGLLLMEPDHMPVHFDPFRTHIRRYFDALAGARMSKVEAALRYAMSLSFADIVLVGVSRAAELREILSFAAAGPSATVDFSEFASRTPELVDPTRWRLGGTF